MKATGTISRSTTNITGSGTKFLTDCAVGNTITVNGVTSVIATIVSDTSMTTTESGTIAAGSTMYVSSLPTYASTSTLQYCPYVVYYEAQPNELASLYENETFDHNLENIVLSKSAVEASMRRSDMGAVQKHENDYQLELKRVKEIIRASRSDLMNRSNPPYGNY
jgi:hypothetical protein